MEQKEVFVDNVLCIMSKNLFIEKKDIFYSN